ncbi:MAG TPA: SH3 domain-containing protein [Anaerolineae bacterium]|nr:SH3 domain-containing protein [Anaerolineae bacterium]
MNFDRMPRISGGRAKNIVLPVLFLLLLFSLGACGGGGDDGEAPTARTGKLDCAEECVLYGQCGTNQENKTVILGNSSQPETRNHNMTLPKDTAVTILSEQQKLVMFPETKIEAPELFYQVQTEDGATTGWVAAWCVAVNE